ncbi:hypothetical protein EDC22_102363 [Tepidamorphus gemmatus]|uniref:Uncharacterized protein n=1 Tax=Tepidamorphus gemmatus TaxID=747076 RepID=A0A4R3MHK0_9HYPH|nr:hypothetical protein EDC22_102363 [Tepidamorphus gemmatus]
MTVVAHVAHAAPGRMNDEQRMRANAALRRSGIEYQIVGDVDMREMARAISRRFPKTTEKLAKS